jgi:hypothetical protein
MPLVALIGLVATTANAQVRSQTGQKTWSVSTCIQNALNSKAAKTEAGARAWCNNKAEEQRAKGRTVVN